MSSGPEVVVLGAGLAGMTAAYHLRQRDLVVIEARDRVGGRTLSGGQNGYWYNSGAQFVWDPRTVKLCQELGLEVIDAKGARSAVFLRGRLAVAAGPLGLLLQMPMSLGEKVDFARTISRLRRRAGRMHGFDAELDRQSLADVVGAVSPVTAEIIGMAAESGTGLGLDQLSGAVGLAYAIHLFGGDVNDTLKAVRGGTQQISLAAAEAVDPERVMLGCTVESVAPDAGGVKIRYRRAGGQVEEIEARACISAMTADAVLQTVEGLPDGKREALEKMLPYAPIVTIAWVTDEDRPMPWDDLLAVPVLGASFELFSHTGFFARRADPGSGRRPGGAFVTLSTAGRGAALIDLDDAAAVERVRADLGRMFPAAFDVLARATTKVQRWRGLPGFRPGWLTRQAALRQPLGSLFFCGDYTAQPGTPGAIGSGYHAAQAVLKALG